jgi:DNA-binding LacI/PurR family transcriptional regulator
LLAERKLVHLTKGRRTSVGGNAAPLTNRLAEVGLIFAGTHTLFMSSDYMIQILRGIMFESDAVRANVRIICIPPGQRHPSPSDVDADGLDGIICLSTRIMGKRFRDYLKEGICTVVADGWASDLPADCVVCDNELAGEKIIGHLMDLGHRRIAYVESAPEDRTGGDKGLLPEVSDAQERREAYLHAMQKAGLPTRILESPPAFPPGGETRSDAMASWAQQVYRMEELPTALVAYDVFIAHRVLSSLEQIGKSVPADMSVAGIAGSPGDAIIRGRTPTYCNFDFLDMGRQAMRILAERCRQHHRPRLRPHVTRIGCQLILGDTVGAPAQRPEFQIASYAPRPV